MELKQLRLAKFTWLTFKIQASQRLHGPFNRSPTASRERPQQPDESSQSAFHAPRSSTVSGPTPAKPSSTPSTSCSTCRRSCWRTSLNLDPVDANLAKDIASGSISGSMLRTRQWQLSPQSFAAPGLLQGPPAQIRSKGNGRATCFQSSELPTPTKITF